MHVKTPPESPVRVNWAAKSERLYNSREARQLLGGISVSKFRQLTKSGELAAKKQGAFVYVPQSAIDAYIAALPAATAA
jgi:helix-turn-helix protein